MFLERRFRNIEAAQKYLTMNVTYVTTIAYLWLAGGLRRPSALRPINP